MKQASLIFLVFIYAFSTTGIAVKADYCCNNLSSVKLVLADGAKDKEGCCKIKYQSFKINDVHAAAHIILTPALHYTHIHLLNIYFQSGIVASTPVTATNIHGPPLHTLIPAYISNCVFRI